MNSDRFARWALRLRWFACLSVGVIVAASYLVFQPARAQERPAAGAAAAPGPASKAAPRPGLLSPDEGERRAADALAQSEKPKAETKPREAEGVKAEDFNLIEVVREGGVHMWTVYAIIVLSVVTVAFAIERALALRRSKILPPELTAGLKALAGQKSGFDPRQAYRLCRQNPSAAATVVKTMLVKVGRPISEIEHAAADASEREASRLYANVRWQHRAFNLGPMLGLVGTVYGVILAFFVTSKLPLGVNKMESLATGIYAALVCTFAGLVVAIPAGVLAHVFEGRIMKLFREIDDIMLALVPHLERYEGRPRPGKSSGEKARSPAEPAPAEVLPAETAIDNGDKWPGSSPS
jgi:biopolymer transport protein ExbB